jgi:lipid-binding SYLF domain-containing protein
MKRLIVSSAVVFLMVLLSSIASASEETITRLDERIQNCIALLEEIMQMPDKGIPEDLLADCSGIAIFPSVIKGGFIIGGRYGKGVVLRHDPKTGKWSPPAFYTVKGLSYGLQIGGQAIDLVLVITTDRGMKSFLEDELSLGGDIGVAAGPVGRTAAADTDLKLKASIFSYSRSKGLFAGISLKGAVIKPDDKANEKYYGKALTPEEILFENKVQPTATARQLIDVLEKYSKK